MNGIEEAQAIVNRKEQARFTTDMLINHNKTEFRLTCFDTWPMIPAQKGKSPKLMKDIVAEVILTPTHAKALLKALEDNIAKYEKAFGEIKLPEQPKLESGQSQGRTETMFR